MPEILVPTIVVSRSAFEDAASWALMVANFDFLNDASRYGLFEEDEFLPDCAVLYHLFIYDGEVKNGGHEQFIANSRWKRQVNDLIEGGLSKIGAVHFADLFRQVRTHVDADPLRLNGMKRRGGFNDVGGGQTDSWLKEMDGEFYSRDRAEALLGIGSEYIRRHPALTVVPDDERLARIQEIARSNPYLAQRSAERQRQAQMREMAYELKVNACKQLGLKIGQSINATSGTIARCLIDGRELGVVVHRTDHNQQVAYFELGGKAIVASYPEGEKLAEVALDHRHH